VGLSLLEACQDDDSSPRNPNGNKPNEPPGDSARIQEQAIPLDSFPAGLDAQGLQACLLTRQEIRSTADSLALTLEYTYDSLGRPTSVDFSDGRSWEYRYGPAQITRRERDTSGIQERVYELDAQGRLTRQRLLLEDGKPLEETQYRYDSEGYLQTREIRVFSEADSLGSELERVLTFERDVRLGRLRELVFQSVTYRQGMPRDTFINREKYDYLQGEFALRSYQPLSGTLPSLDGRPDNVLFSRIQTRFANSLDEPGSLAFQSLVEYTFDSTQTLIVQAREIQTTYNSDGSITERDSFFYSFDYDCDWEP
jgi:uncharacterized protein RhaS with RHS repeats